MSFPAYDRYRPSGVNWLGDVPAHWAIVPIKHLAGIRYGIGEPPAYREEGVPLIRATNVDHGKVSLAGLVRVDPGDIPERRIVWLAAGDIIVVRSGAYTGDSALMRDEHLPAIAGFDMVLRPSACVPAFLQFALLSAYLKEGQIDLERTRAAQPHLNAEELGSCVVVVPPTAEQTAIAAFLDQETAKIDALVEAQQRLIQLLKEKRQAAIAHAVTKGLDPSVPMKDSGVEWLGQVPAHWEVKPARHVFVERDERSPTGSETLLTVSHLTGVTPRSEKSVNMFEAETTEGYKQCYSGDLVINTLWAWMGAMGVARQSGIVSPAYNVYTPRASYDSSYVHAVVRMPAFARETERFSKGVWSSRLRLYPAEFFQIALPIPPLDEQIAIARSLERYSFEYEALAHEAELAITFLQERRKALISAAVTGKIDVGGLSQAAEAA